MGTFDGPGLRLVVFLQGCPFRCLYCANPDTIDPKGESKETRPEEILEMAVSQKPFYGKKGGITFSGGEPTVQAEALIPLFQALKAQGIHICLDSNGGVWNKHVETLLGLTDLVLLDVMLPVLDGWGVCAKIRETSKCPIIMLTAKGEVNDRIHGLEMGADDYVVKPFEMKELLARINAVLRRSEIPEDTHKRLTFDKLIIDLDSYELIVDGKKIDTPPKELELLYHLAATPNRVYTRNQLLDEVWGFDYFGDSRTVDVHVKRLREKVENVSDQWALKTVWGVGYKFEVK